MLNAGRHLLGLINDVLDLSKIEAGKMELFLETFELRQGGHGGRRHRLARSSPRTATRSRSMCPADIGTMHADATKLRQMLLNLLSNASKFTEHGTITLEGHPRAGRGRGSS